MENNMNVRTASAVQTACALELKTIVGTDTNGKDITRNITFSNIKVEATAPKMYAVGIAIEKLFDTGCSVISFGKRDYSILEPNA